MFSDLSSDDVRAVCGCAALHTLHREFALFGPFSIGLRTNQESRRGCGVAAEPLAGPPKSQKTTLNRLHCMFHDILAPCARSRDGMQHNISSEAELLGDSQSTILVIYLKNCIGRKLVSDSESSRRLPVEQQPLAQLTLGFVRQDGMHCKRQVT